MSISRGSAFPERIETTRLVLRRPVESDRALWVALHRDPALYRHAPYAIFPSEQAAGANFEDALSHWQSRGFGYQIVELAGRADLTGRNTTFQLEGCVTPIGLGGLRTGREGELNLYYRFAAETHGQGYAREATRAWVTAGLEHLDDTVTAVAKEHNVASVRTALTAGLSRTGSRTLSDDPLGSAPSVVFTAPTVEVFRAAGLPDPVAGEVLELWLRVTEQGGSVGFVPGDSRADHAQALAAHEQQMRDGRAVAVLLRDPGSGELVSIGWWVQEDSPRYVHRRTAYRVMTDPARRGRNLGRLQLAAMHRVARADGVELALLGGRGGMGLEAFYQRCGYAEVGRIPGGIRVAPGEDRDDVTMARRL